MNVNYCSTAMHSAYLNTQFGRELAQLWFGFDNTIIESFVGRYTRGKRKGQLRGMLRWRKAERGGWSRGRGVVLPGTISQREIFDAFTGELIYSEAETPQVPR